MPVSGFTGKERGMKFPAAVALFVALAVSGTARAADPPALAGEKEKLGYSLGMDIGNALKSQSVDLDVDSLARGLKDAYTGGKTLLTEEESRRQIESYQQRMMEKEAEAMRQLAEKNKAEGVMFLAENGKKEGVTTLPSGLQYQVITPGAGKSPKASDTVTTHYRGTLIDGKEFDSSYKRGEPASFPVSGVIAGWTEALQLMKEGAKWRIFLPPGLAYGERGVGRDIGPNATLIFEVELISVK
jgi:FKBP-type peptidyl-prolyl cis-trans isomerase